MRPHTPAFVDGNLLVRLLVEDHPHLQVVLEQRGLTHEPGVDVLVDEPPAVSVDDHAAHHHSRHQRDPDLARRHVLDGRADGLGHHDAAAVVAAVAVDTQADELRCVLGHHLGVVGETAGRDDHAAAGTVGDDVVEVPGHDTDDPVAVGLVPDQAQGPGVGVDRDVGCRDGLGQYRHEHLAAEPVGGDPVPARRGCGDLGERIGVLAHPHQAVVGRRHPRRRIPQRRLERHPVIGEPSVVVDAVTAVEADLLPVGVRAECGEEELLHGVRGVGEPARLLDRGAATEIHLAAGQRRRSAAAALSFEQDHVGARGVGLECRGRPRAAVTDDQHVGLVIERADRCDVERGGGYGGAHAELLSSEPAMTVVPVTVGRVRSWGKTGVRWAGHAPRDTKTRRGCEAVTLRRSPHNICA